MTLAAVLYEPAFFVVATSFTRQRGRALTVLTFIAGFASVIYIPLAGWFVQQQGWRGALVTLARILGVGTIPCMLWRCDGGRRISDYLLTGPTAVSPTSLRG